jgi:hypothetical protein
MRQIGLEMTQEIKSNSVQCKSTRYIMNVVLLCRGVKGG